MKAAKLSLVVSLGAFVGACANAPPPRESHQFNRPMPPAYIGDGPVRERLDQEFASALDTARRELRARYGAPNGQGVEVTDADAVIFVQNLRNEIDPYAAIVLEFDRDANRMPLMLLDQMLEGTTILAAQQFVPETSLPCMYNTPRVDLSGTRQLYLETTISSRDILFEEQRTGAPYITSSAGDSADLDLGSGSQLTRFFVTVSLRYCGLGHAVKTVSRPVEVYAFNRARSISMGGRDLGLYAGSSLKDAYGQNFALLQALVQINAEVLGEGLKMAGVEGVEKTRSKVPPYSISLTMEHGPCGLRACSDYDTE